MYFATSEKARFSYILVIYLVSLLDTVFSRYDYMIFEHFEMTKTNFLREQYIIRELIKDRKVMSKTLHSLTGLMDTHQVMEVRKSSMS